MSANMDELEKKWEEEMKKRQQQSQASNNPQGSENPNNPSDWEPVAENVGKPEEGEEHMEEPPDEVLLALLNIPLEISVEVGSKRISLEELFSLKPTSVIVLDKMLSDPVDIKVNGKKIAEGELVVVNDRFGVKITKIVSPDERIKKIKS
jgi:flagellar motor switch protein FliN/FliY